MTRWVTGRASSRRRWSGGPNVYVGIAPTSVGCLHGLGRGTLDPARRVISDHGVVPGGRVLLAPAAAGCAVACVVSAASPRPAGLPRPELPVALLTGGAAGLLVTAVFPTNGPGTPVGVIANVHRAGGAMAFVTLPPAGWLAARRAATGARRLSVTLRRWSGVAMVISATHLLFHVPIVIGGSRGFPYIGGVERVLCMAVLVVLYTTARATRMAIGGARVNDAGSSYGSPLHAPLVGGAA